MRDLNLVVEKVIFGSLDLLLEGEIRLLLVFRGLLFNNFNYSNLFSWFLCFRIVYI